MCAHDVCDACACASVHVCVYAFSVGAHFLINDRIAFRFSYVLA